jgi:pyruvate/2-oxoacid:ferredoxin oxidoreductase alpha subunit
MCDFTYRAFEIADFYRATVFILTDAYIGQMMEPVELPTEVKHGERKEWALYADAASRSNLISSIRMSTKSMSNHNLALQAKYDRMEAEITDWEEVDTEDAELLLVAFGISARVSLTAVQRLRSDGVKAGLLRPKTLFPFPRKRLSELGKSGHLKRAAVVELNTGMMADDVQLALPDTVEVTRCNWLGGEVPSTEDVMERVVVGLANTAVQ